MNDFDVRYVMVSDYATMDQAGKLVVAGLYTEDMVVPAVPASVGPLVFTVLATNPRGAQELKMRLRAPSGATIVEGNIKIDTSPVIEGSEGRAIIGFQFRQLTFPETGRYSMSFSSIGKDKSEREIHNFRIVVGEVAGPLAPTELTNFN